jgi:hypothetical protein
METKKLRCSCAHEYQDEKYGAGIRVHNYGEKKSVGGNAGYACTVCGNVKPVGST